VGEAYFFVQLLFYFILFYFIFKKIEIYYGLVKLKYFIILAPNRNNFIICVIKVNTA
jgi:hypothetical protein